MQIRVIKHIRNATAAKTVKQHRSLLNLMCDRLVESPVVHCDETRIQVLKKVDRERTAWGQVITVLYADDSVIGFAKHDDAWGFRHALEVRLAKFNLTLHPEKIRFLRFGWFAVENRKKRGDSSFIIRSA